MQEEVMRPDEAWEAYRGLRLPQVLSAEQRLGRSECGCLGSGHVVLWRPL
jgi:hypothetical protein